MIDFKGKLVILAIILTIGSCLYAGHTFSMHEKYSNMMQECYEDYDKMMIEFRRVWNHVTDLPEEEVRKICINSTNERLKNERKNP